MKAKGLEGVISKLIIFTASSKLMQKRFSQPKRHIVFDTEMEKVSDEKIYKKVIQMNLSNAFQKLQITLH